MGTPPSEYGKNTLLYYWIQYVFMEKTNHLPGVFREFANLIRLSSRDWSATREDAWMYGIIRGWDPESLSKISPRFGWTGGDRIRLMTLHTAYVEASRICFDPMTIQKSDMGDLSKPIRCSVCGHFIGHRDLDLGRATRTQVTPDNAFGPEKWENICPKCRGL